MICWERSSLHVTQCRRNTRNTEQKLVDFSVCTNSENSSAKHQSNHWISFTFLNKFLILQTVKAGVNLKFAQKLSFLFSSEFAALGIQLRYGKIIFYLFSLFLSFWAISKFPLWLMVWLPWQREEHFLIFQLFMMCYSGNQAPKRAGFNERYFM